MKIITADDRKRMFLTFHIICNVNFIKPVYNCGLGPAAACSVVWGFPCCSLKTNGWPWADIFSPVGLLSLWNIHHTLSPYIYWLNMYVIMFIFPHMFIYLQAGKWYLFQQNVLSPFILIPIPPYTFIWGGMQSFKWIMHIL